MIAKISGHEDLGSFMRYYNPKAEAMRKKMVEADRRRLAKGELGGESMIEAAASMLSEMPADKAAKVIALVLAKRTAV